MIRTFYSWRSKVEKWSKASTKQFAEQAQPKLTEIGELLAKRVENNIRRQRIEGPPLAPFTIEKKGHAKKLIDFGVYLRSLKVTPATLSDRGRKVFLIVDVMPLSGDKRPNELWAYMEFGTSTIPARPHWRPAVAYLRNNEFQDFLKGKWFALTYPNSARTP